MSNFSNNPLQDLLASIPDIILIILFCNLKTFYTLVEFPPKNDSMFNKQVDVSKVHCS